MSGEAMRERIEIRIIADSTLVGYFATGLSERHIDYSVAEELSSFLTMLLNDSLYPIAARQSGAGEITLSYRPRAFADPIF